MKSCLSSWVWASIETPTIPHLKQENYWTYTAGLLFWNVCVATMTTMLFWKFRLSCLPRLAEDLQSADGIGPKRMDPAKDWTPDQLAKFLQPLLPRHPAMLLILVPAQAGYFQPWFHMLHRTCFWQNALELTVWRACGQVLSSQSVLVKLTQRLRPVSGWLSAWHMNRGDPSLESLPCSRLSSTWRLEILMMFWPCSYWHRIPKFSCLQKLGCWERSTNWLT